MRLFLMGDRHNVALPNWASIALGFTLEDLDRYPRSIREFHIVTAAIIATVMALLVLWGPFVAQMGA